VKLAYRTRYGYPWRWALAAEFWWRVEHLFYRRYRGSDGGMFGSVNRVAYRYRKAAERRGAH
jgi:hypothetical protein